MNIIILLVVGGLLGWVTVLLMSTDAQQGMVLNVVVGIVGALLGGWLLSPIFDESSIGQANIVFLGLLISLMGAVAPLAIVNLFRRRAAR